MGGGLQREGDEQLETNSRLYNFKVQGHTN